MTIYSFLCKNAPGLLVLVCLAAWLPSCKKYSPYSYIKPEVILYEYNSRLSNNSIHLHSDTVYVLAAHLIMDSGQDLTIDAGTLIKVNDDLDITIRQGATIHAKGTTAEPIVFTSSAPQGTAGLVGEPGSVGTHVWRGIQIYGAAGTDPSSPGSGVLNYARIEFAGKALSQAPFFRFSGSLYLNNVSANTNIEHIQVSYSYEDPSFEFAGGNCDARYLVSYASGQTDVSLHQGYKGRLQNILAYRHPYFPASNAAPIGVYIYDDSTYPSISNLTILGPDPSQTSNNSTYITNSQSAAFLATTGAKFHIRNSILLGYTKTGWYLGDAAVAAGIANNSSDFKYSIFQCNDSSRTFYLVPGSYNPYNSHSFRNYLLLPDFANNLYLKVGDFILKDPFNYDVYPDPTPDTSSSILTGANFDAAPFDDAFFNKVDYRGALGKDSWIKDWTNFTPLKTKYNIK